MASNPAIVIVPGSFSMVSLYDKVVTAIKAAGFDTVEVVDLASTGKKDPPATLQDDVNAIRAVVEGLADQGKDVILVPHSYGGVPTSQSIEQISKEHRAKAGKKGGVVHLLYITSIAPALGESIATTVPAADNEDQAMRLDGAYLEAIPENHSHKTFSDLPKEEGLSWARQFPAQSAVTFATPLTYAGYKDVSVTYFLAEGDKLITPEVQLKIIDNIERARGGEIEVLKYNTGHVPHLSKPEAVTDAIKKVAARV